MWNLDLCTNGGLPSLEGFYKSNPSRDTKVQSAEGLQAIMCSWPPRYIAAANHFVSLLNMEKCGMVQFNWMKLISISNIRYLRMLIPKEFYKLFS